jgi:hypothetical protein
MSERGPRELPKIDIAGELYFIDLRLNEFRHVDDFMNRIFIDEDLYEKDDKYTLAYDKVHKCVFRGDAQEFDARIGKGIVIVELPSLKQMDPVGFKWLCANLEEHQRSLTTLLRFADQHIKWMEEGRAKKQKAMKPLLEKKRERKDKGRRI